MSGGRSEESRFEEHGFEEGLEVGEERGEAVLGVEVGDEGCEEGEERCEGIETAGVGL